MKKSTYIIFIISTILILNLVGCSTNKDSETVLSSNVLEDLKNDECDAIELLQRGDDCLNANDYTSAKAFYEKAVMKDKMNIDTYSKIKDKYFEINRLDDAYYFINLAIDNGVDKDNMTKILADIKSKFTPITLSNTIVKSSAFSLPTKVDVSVNNTDIETCDVTWDTSANTNNLGSFIYNGFCNKYHRTVTYNLTIREPIKAHKIGFITAINNNGTFTLDFDEAQFYLDNDTAVKEYLVDNPNASTLDLNCVEYFIRNTSKEKVTYKISPNCSYSLCVHTFPDIDMSKFELKSELISVDENYFKNYVAEAKNKFDALFNGTSGNRALLMWIDTEDDVITNITMQYTP
jgi:hypothetical protein